MSFTYTFVSTWVDLLSNCVPRNGSIYQKIVTKYNDTQILSTLLAKIKIFHSNSRVKHVQRDALKRFVKRYAICIEK